MMHIIQETEAYQLRPKIKDPGESWEEVNTKENHEIQLLYKCSHSWRF